MITIINCYAPHSELTKKKMEDTERFYEKLVRLVNKYKFKSSIVIVAGDINVTVGRKKNETCIGRHLKGYNNGNGDYLIHFCQNNELLRINTSFKHKQSHLTTSHQTSINKGRHNI